MTDPEQAKVTPLIERLRVHDISGYEWECSECHYHFAAWANGERIAEICPECGQPITADNDGYYVDSTGRITDHSSLVSREHLALLLAEAAKQPPDNFGEQPAAAGQKLPRGLAHLDLEGTPVERGVSQTMRLSSTPSSAALAAAASELRAALEEANTIIALFRAHCSKDHLNCAWAALGVMQDAARAAIATPSAAPALRDESLLDDYRTLAAVVEEYDEAGTITGAFHQRTGYWPHDVPSAYLHAAPEGGLLGLDVERLARAMSVSLDMYGWDLDSMARDVVAAYDNATDEVRR